MSINFKVVLLFLKRALVINIFNEIAKKMLKFDSELYGIAQELKYQTNIILELYMCSLDYAMLFVVPYNLYLMLA